MLNSVNLRKYYSDRNKLYMAIIELNTTCNWNCIHCYINSKNHSGLAYSDICELLIELRKVGVYEIQFTGGEMFLRKDIMEIISFARSLYFKVALLTNGSLLTKEIIEQLDKLGVEIVTTTLFSMKDEINDLITRSNNSASMLLKNIELLSKTNIKTEIKTILMKDNQAEYMNIKDYCEKLNIDFLATEGIFPMFDGSLEPRKLSLSDTQLKKEIKNLDYIRFKSMFCEEKKSNHKICCELHYSLFINSRGDIYPCNLWFKKLGNIKKDLISEIWNSEFLTRIRNTTWRDLKECYHCDNKCYCIRCTGIAEAVSGDYLGKDPFSCRTANIRKEIFDERR